MQEVNWFEMGYQVAGGLGLFFFGLKSLSDGLQAIGSRIIRQIIHSLTTNRVMAVLVGIAVTAFVQSSSITTVMVVSFVNAGLMNLTQAIGVIFGANIGTTITGWIISIKIGKYALVFVALGTVPMIFSRNERVASWGKTLFALGLLFLGLSTMSGAFKPLRSHEGFLNLMTLISADSYLSILAAVSIGCLLTFVIQSSSAMLAITIALASSGSITFQTAAALVMGENVGTTITALLAGVGANTAAKRAALSHAIFNVLGVFVLSLLFHPYLQLVESLIPHAADAVSSTGEKPYIAAHVASAHSIFNIVNVLIFLPFIGLLSKLVTLILPDPAVKEVKHLEAFGPSGTLSPSIAIEEAYLAIDKMLGLVKSSLEYLKDYVFSEVEDEKLKQQIDKYEGITDNIHTEMTVFLGKVMTSYLTSEDTEQVKALLRMADEAESICDYVAAVARYTERAFRENLQLDETTRAELKALFEEALHLFNLVHQAIENREAVDVPSYKASVKRLNTQAEGMKSNYLARLREHKYPALGSLTVSDIAVSIRRIKNHTVNLKQAYTLTE